MGAAIWFGSRVSIVSPFTYRERCRYISTGTGRGNPYGLAAACGVLFPFMMFGRLYWPGPPMTNILFFVTAALVSIRPKAPEERVFTRTRLSAIPGTTPTPSLPRPFPTGVLISRL